MKKILTILLLLIFLKVTSQDKNIITNESIIEYRKNQFSKPLIISMINSSTCMFQLSTEAMIALKKAGVEDDIIQAMVEKSNRKVDESTAAGPYDKLTPGIYALDSISGAISEIEPA